MPGLLLAYWQALGLISLPTSLANARLVLKSGLLRETKDGIAAEAVAEMAFLPSNSQFSSNELARSRGDRQEEIRVQFVPR